MSSFAPVDWLRPEIRALTAYAVPKAGSMIKLDAMENPYSWPEALRADWQACLGAVDVNRYPDSGSERLQAALRTNLNIPPSMAMMLGNGSDELLQLVMLALARPGATVVVPEPSFSMYRIVAAIAGLHYVGVSLQAESFELDVQQLLRAIREHNPALVILCHPNNPTGNLFNSDAILEIVAAAPGLVMIDEAYFHFARQSMLAHVGHIDNVVVLRTLSKLGLAGLRIGVLAGGHAWLDELEKLRLPYNVNALSQAGATFMLQHAEVLHEQVEQILRDRMHMAETLRNEFAGLKVWESSTNFLCMRIPEVGRRLWQALAERGVLVKNLHGSHDLLADCIRVTVGTRDENKIFLSALRACT